MYLFAILLFSRSTSGTAVNASGLSGLPANSDTKIATSPPGSGNSPGVVALGTKYDPYTGASFRENPDYSDLVIGRATGCSSSTSHVPGTLMEANRTGSYQLYGLHERRPLRGLFDSTPSQSQISLSQAPSMMAKHISPDGSVKTSRINMSGGESTSVQPESVEECPMLCASVVGIGLTEPQTSSSSAEKPNISTIGSEVSAFFSSK
ncbi:hypothetical protein FBUS_09877 [Fasciolopsis buskii]|uniref:Uncharacterized protein n=1 Tax=Fasciolopsis buskii TaxID=27845 RepID=A0A8E0S583_9TREM|nr:hypothetical protein FBUS_09877 [Fasciolopsis buski]